MIEQDPMFGTECWEQAESAMQKQTADLALEKSGFHRRDIRYLFAGDLLGQLIATSFGTVDLEIPLFGLYGACSTMGEALSLGAMCVDAGHADKVLCLASSHYATAEKQFRFPLGYGNQRPLCATWTVTGCGAVVLSKDPQRLGTGGRGVSGSGVDDGGGDDDSGACGSGAGGGSGVRIAGITTGRMVDLGARDSMNMGAAMAPAAWDYQSAGILRTWEWISGIMTRSSPETWERWGRRLCWISSARTGWICRKSIWTVGWRSTTGRSRILTPEEADAAVRR